MTNCDICNEPIHRQPHPVEYMINSCSVCGWHSMMEEDEQTQVRGWLNSAQVISLVKDVNSLLTNLYNEYCSRSGAARGNVGDLLDEAGNLLNHLRVPMDLHLNPSIDTNRLDSLMSREKRLQSFFSTIKTVSVMEDLHSDRYREMMTALCEQYLEDTVVKEALEDYK